MRLRLQRKLWKSQIYDCQVFVKLSKLVERRRNYKRIMLGSYFTRMKISRFGVIIGAIIMVPVLPGV